MIPGDELFSDTYPMKLVDDCIYEVYGKVRLGAVVTVKSAHREHQEIIACV